MQEVYINLDDSGKLSSKELISVYGGIIFFSKNEKDKFITQYRSIINSIKCNYCNNCKDNCNKKCPEVKNINIKASDKRRIMNYLKRYYVVALVIQNACIFDYIISDKASKGRYVDYTMRRLIKEVIKDIINKKKIDSHKPVKLIINIDQQATKSNGYYNLKDGLKEELIHGIRNFDYQKKFKPVLFSNLDLLLNYQDSLKSYVIQASDLLAGSIRRICLDDGIDKLDIFVDLKVIFP